MLKQRIVGMVILLLSVAILLMASQGTTVEDRDVTVLLFLVPLGIYTLFTKKRILYDLTEEDTPQDATERHPLHARIRCK